MEARLVKLMRIVRVKEHLRRAAEWRLAELSRLEQEAASEEESLLAALNAGHPLHGHLVDAMAAHLRHVATRLEKLRAAKATETDRLRLETGQLRHAERMLADVDKEHRRAVERKELADLIDAALRRSSASLP